MEIKEAYDTTISEKGNLLHRCILAPNVAQPTDPAQLGLSSQELVVNPACAPWICTAFSVLGLVVAVHASPRGRQEKPYKTTVLLAVCCLSAGVLAILGLALDSAFFGLCECPRLHRHMHALSE